MRVHQTQIIRRHKQILIRDRDERRPIHDPVVIRSGAGDVQTAEHGRREDGPVWLECAGGACEEVDVVQGRVGRV